MPGPVGYLRKSKSDDPAKEVSREVQEQAIRELAARDGINGDLQLYVDWDRSADEKKASRRTEFAALNRAIEAGEVSTIYAYSVDRLYRSLATFVRLTEAATRKGVRIVTSREGVLGGDGSPMAQAFAQLTAVFAELELNTAKARAKSAYQARVRRGDHVGQAPYGSRLTRVDGVVRLEPDPARPLGPVIDAYRRAGSRTRVAVRILNDELRLPSPYGRLWDRVSLLRVIEREAPSLLPQRTALGRRAQPATPALLAKLLRCHCGRLLTPNRHVERRHRRETRSVSYYCARGHASPATHPGGYYVSELKLLPFVKAEAAFVNMTGKPVQSGGENDAAALTALEAKRQRVIDTYVNGMIEAADRDRRVVEIDDELAVIRTRAEAAQRIVALPPIDWDGPAQDVNVALRALWHYVELDAELKPVRAEWAIPEWRAEE